MCQPRLASAASTVGRRSLICLPLASVTAALPLLSGPVSLQSPLPVLLCVSHSHIPQQAGRQRGGKCDDSIKCRHTNDHSFSSLSQPNAHPSLSPLYPPRPPLYSTSLTAHCSFLFHSHSQSHSHTFARDIVVVVISSTYILCESNFIQKAEL